MSTKWLKCEACYAHGYGPAEYIEVLSGADLESIKSDFQYEHPDRDGFRAPRFELLEQLPPDVLATKIRHARSAIVAWQAFIERHSQ